MRLKVIKHKESLKKNKINDWCFIITLSVQSLSNCKNKVDTGGGGIQRGDVDGSTARGDGRSLLNLHGKDALLLMDNTCYHLLSSSGQPY